MARVQRGYSIPDVELRESLKRDNKEYILPKYNAFYEKFVFSALIFVIIIVLAVILNSFMFCFRYASLQFTKNPEKYVKYTGVQVSAMIDRFFDVAA